MQSNHHSTSPLPFSPGATSISYTFNDTNTNNNNNFINASTVNMYTDPGTRLQHNGQGVPVGESEMSKNESSSVKGKENASAAVNNKSRRGSGSERIMNDQPGEGAAALLLGFSNSTTTDKDSRVAGATTSTAKWREWRKSVGQERDSRVDFPSEMLPKEKKHITLTHAEGYFHFLRYFINHPKFDNELRKKIHQDGNFYLEYDENLGNSFVLILRELHDELSREGRRIFDEYITDQFKEAGFKYKKSPQGAVTASECRNIIGSDASKLASKKDPLFMLRFTYQHVHTAGSENHLFYTQSLIPGIMGFMKEKYPLFNFLDKVPNLSKGGESRKKTVLHNIIKIASSGSTSIRKSFQECEMRNFHMSVRISRSSVTAGEVLLPIDLSQDGKNTGAKKGPYLVVDKSMFQGAGIVGDDGDWTKPEVSVRMRKYIECDEITRAAYRFAKVVLAESVNADLAMEVFKKAMNELSDLVGPAQSGSGGMFVYSPHQDNPRLHDAPQQSHPINHDLNNSNVNQRQLQYVSQQNQQMNPDTSTMGLQQSQQMNHNLNNINVNQHQQQCVPQQFQQMNHDTSLLQQSSQFVHPQEPNQHKPVSYNQHQGLPDHHQQQDIGQGQLNIYEDDIEDIIEEGMTKDRSDVCGINGGGRRSVLEKISGPLPSITKDQQKKTKPARRKNRSNHDKENVGAKKTNKRSSMAGGENEDRDVLREAQFELDTSKVSNVTCLFWY